MGSWPSTDARHAGPCPAMDSTGRASPEHVMQLERDAGREPADVHRRGLPFTTSREKMTITRKYLAVFTAALAILAALLGHALLSAPTSHASVYQDQEFYWLLTEPDQERPLVIWDFPLVRSQGIRNCQQMDSGETPMQALYHLDRRYGGPYIFDDANNIVSSAAVIYCPWHGSWPDTPGGPQDRTESRAISPLPVYPPLMWSPGGGGAGGG